MPEAELVYIQRARQLLRAGDPLLALEQILAGLQHYHDSVTLQQQHALALARSGSPHSANHILLLLVEGGHADPETLGLLARTYKDLGFSSTGAVQREHFSRALELYLKAYRMEGDPWPGVNAATLSLLLDQREEALRLASEVRAKTRERLDLQALDPNTNAGDKYWLHATLAETALIHGDVTEAENAYALAVGFATGLGDLVTTRRNARALLRHFGIQSNRIETCFGIPQVAVFSGHMLDLPGRPRPRFPAEREASVAAQIRECLARRGKVSGYAGASAGSDILFHEALHALGGESHVVLPCTPKEYMEESLPATLDGTWRERFEAVITNAADITVVSEQKGQVHGVSYEYSNLFREGLAILQARQMETNVVRMVVWDHGPGDGRGGTASVATRWQAQGFLVERIGTGYDAPQSARPGESNATAPAGSLDMKLVGIIFADALHFSAIVEPRIPDFVEHFLGAVAAALAASSVRPLIKNTWGDGFYFVCGSPADAGTLALDICDSINSVNWTSRKLPADLALRIGVHAGPAYYCVDPVLGSSSFFGAHISRAARIEPVTPPGQVYASQGFAAIAAAQEISGFDLEYVGRVPLAKSAGLMPMYRLSR